MGLGDVSEQDGVKTVQPNQAPLQRWSGLQGNAATHRYSCEQSACVA